MQFSMNISAIADTKTKVLLYLGRHPEHFHRTTVQTLWVSLSRCVLPLIILSLHKVAQSSLAVQIFVEVRDRVPERYF